MPLTTWVIQKKPQSGEGGGKMHAVGGGGGAGEEHGEEGHLGVSGPFSELVSPLHEPQFPSL